MSGPEVSCATCGRTRDPMRHMRADHPPTAARQWLRKHCKSTTRPLPCAFKYRAGVDVEGLKRSLKNPDQ